MALPDYKSNIIKQIYGNEIFNNSQATNTEVENYYKYNSNFNNCIEFPDTLSIVASYHGFTPYPLTVNRTESLSDENMSKIGFPITIVNSHLAYFKLMNEKDIDWENAYLRYSGNYQTCDPEKPIEYKEIIAELDENDKMVLTKHERNTGDQFLFKRGLCSYINNSYELLNIIDYLLLRIQALWFMIGVIKDQNINISMYRDFNSQDTEENPEP